MNILLITQQQDGVDNPALMSTPHFVFSGVKPDYGIYFCLAVLVLSKDQEMETIHKTILNRIVCWVLLSVEVNILTV